MAIAFALGVTITIAVICLTLFGKLGQQVDIKVSAKPESERK